MVVAEGASPAWGNALAEQAESFTHEPRHGCTAVDNPQDMHK